MIELGKAVRCIATGYEGIVVARCDYISGVSEYGVRGKTSVDSTRPSVEYIEEALLEVVGDGITVRPSVKQPGFFWEPAK